MLAKSFVKEEYYIKFYKNYYINILIKIKQLIF